MFARQIAFDSRRRRSSINLLPDSSQWRSRLQQFKCFHNLFSVLDSIVETHHVFRAQSPRWIHRTVIWLIEKVRLSYFAQQVDYHNKEIARVTRLQPYRITGIVPPISCCARGASTIQVWRASSCEENESLALTFVLVNSIPFTSTLTSSSSSGFRREKMFLSRID